MLAEKNEKSARAHIVLTTITQDEIETREHLAREMQIHDEISRLEDAKEKGKEERLSIAKEMLLDKEPMHKIIKYSKLTEYLILKLENEIINDEDQHK